MRTFVIVSPGLSVGRPGQHVTVEELGMDDDDIDLFCEAGHAVELYADGPPAGRVKVDELVAGGTPPKRAKKHDGG